MSKKLILYTDGACRGNPGPAAIGVVICNAQDETLHEIGECIGSTTNNVAEYRALIAALKSAKEWGATDVEVRADSQLLVEQMNGGYKIKSRHLFPLAMEARSLLNSFSQAHLRHVPREQNRRADAVANAALDGKSADSVE